jgi:ABC-type glycerol-3-phosphate transport system substrate-binding protein
VHWCLWAHGGYTVDANDKVIISSPETERALNYAKQLYENMVPGVASWNDASNNKAFLGNEIYWTANTISIYLAAAADQTKREIAEDMDFGSYPSRPMIISRRAVWKWLVAAVGTDADAGTNLAMGAGCARPRARRQAHPSEYGRRR